MATYQTYRIGAPAEVTTNKQGVVRSVTVNWDGSNLVVLTSKTEGPNTTTERETWSLQDNGARLVKVRQSTGSQETSDQRIVFLRQ